MAAELGPTAESRAVEQVNAEVWPADIADRLEWFAGHFGMPLVVRRYPSPRWAKWWPRKTT
ncbi:hypothetical protein [Demequina aestuarii]|uniref:hypothetical protein n=1 Tax=Demequina aestuarii TaxID=327095 RepID=UPI000784EE28|nr:hypothetical protein [Demequina aestuarii]